MARTNRPDSPWRIRGTRRGIAADARSGRIVTDPATVAAMVRTLRTSRRGIAMAADAAAER